MLCPFISQDYRSILKDKLTFHARKQFPLFNDRSFFEKILGIHTEINLFHLGFNALHPENVFLKFIEPCYFFLKFVTHADFANIVYRALGSGFDEVVYQKAMEVGLRLAKIKDQGQKVVELQYKKHCVGEGYPDLVVGEGKNKLILELKAVGGVLGASKEQQIRNYIKILKIKHGLLINFQQPKKEGKSQLEIKEIN